jgi:hypothetical protein
MMKQLNPTHQGWHSLEWGTWGWIETILKLIGIVAAYILFAQTSGPLVIGGNPHLLAVILLVLMTLATLFALVVRYVQKETLSFVFAVLQALGHLALLIAVLRVPSSMTLAVLFGLMFVLGQAAKLRFLSVTGYTEGGSDVQSMKRVAAIMGFIYIALTVFVLL